MVLLAVVTLLASQLSSASGLVASGEQIHCINGSAHLLRYDVEGEPGDGSSMEHVDRALVSLEPAGEEANAACGGTPSGNSTFCLGSNQDGSCRAAEESLDLSEGLECENCFVSVEGEASYKLNYTRTHMHSMELGLRRLKVHASMTVYKGAGHPGVFVDGSLPLGPTNWTLPLIDAKVGCPVCVRLKVEVAVRAYLDFKVTADCEGEFRAGGSVNIDLGDNIVSYNDQSGWNNSAESPIVSAEPVLQVGKDVRGNLTLRTRTSFQLILNDMAAYHFDLAPALPLRLSEVHRGWWPFKRHEACLDSDVGFDLEQEAEIKWKLLLWHKKTRWGPQQIWSWRSPDMLHICKPLDKTQQSPGELLV